MSLELYRNTLADFEVEFAINEDKWELESDQLSSGTEICKKYLKRLWGEVEEHGFDSDEDEIYFFKHVKPNIVCKLILCDELDKIQSLGSSGLKQMEREKLRVIMEGYIGFIEEHKEFYRYYRHHSISQDNRYYLRSNNLGNGHLIYEFVDDDFSTEYSRILAHFIAYDIMKAIVYPKIDDIDCNKSVDSGITGMNKNHVNLRWSGSKTDMVEVILSLHSLNVFNEGQITIKELMSFFAQQFHIKLDGHYRIYTEIKNRKKENAPFLRKMMETFNKKIMKDLG